MTINNLGDAIDTIFSHNSIVAIHYDNKAYYEQLWRGMAWDMPEQFKLCTHWSIHGFIAESIDRSDTINIVVEDDLLRFNDDCLVVNPTKIE